KVIGGMPPVRGRISSKGDSHVAWRAAMRDSADHLGAWEGLQRREVLKHMKSAMRSAAQVTRVGGRYVAGATRFGDPSSWAHWLRDARIEGWINHEARSHMVEDLQRYLFAACFAKETGYSPRLAEFPSSLLPRHQNIGDSNRPFEDRFKVQVFDKPSGTVVSH